MVRTLNKYPAVSGVTGLITLTDIDLAEIDVANLNPIYWPWFDAVNGYVPDSSPRALYDRMNDAERVNLSQISPTDITVTTLAGGTPAIPMLSMNTILRYSASTEGHDYSKGLTMACVVNDALGFCANSTNTGANIGLYWDGSAIIMAGKSVSSAAEDYSGPALDGDTDTVITLRLDPEAGTMTLTVGDGYTQTLSDASFVGWTAHTALQWGVNYDGGLIGRFGYYGQVLLFADNLSDDDIGTVIDYLSVLGG
ncbi:hypothetical protein [Thioclava kandeliae]|uniref:LamG domain-containing protein n=1 Tax=Thioclava kandeliae TaxID=3070818 RepID=A0ABV1SIE1_9RHOB